MAAHVPCDPLDVPIDLTKICIVHPFHTHVVIYGDPNVEAPTLCICNEAAVPGGLLPSETLFSIRWSHTPQKTPLPQTPDTPYEIPPPTPGSKVEKDPVHPLAGTPKRTEPTTNTPSDRGVKDPKPGNRASYPHVVE